MYSKLASLCVSVDKFGKILTILLLSMCRTRSAHVEMLSTAHLCMISKHSGLLKACYCRVYLYVVTIGMMCF